VKKITLFILLISFQLSIVAQATRYEAEDAFVSEINVTNQGFRMTNPSAGNCAYLNNVAGSYIEFTVNVSTGGNFDLTLAYATTGAGYQSKLVVNGTVLTTITWPDSGGQLTTATYKYSNASLNAGNNTIKILHLNGWMCIDYLEIDGKENQTAPGAPTLGSKTTSSVTLTANGSYEYSIDNGANYQNSEVFSGLTESTSYSFVQRYTETATHYASPASSSFSTTTGGSSVSTRYESEEATLNQVIAESWRMTNPSNGSYAYLNNINGSSIEYTFNGSAGEYDVSFDYSTSGAGYASQLLLNGTLLTTINWPDTGAQSTTGTYQYTSKVSLSSGDKIKILHQNGWMCIDHMDVKGGDGINQTITFNTVTDKSVGDATFDLTATASSGLPVTYSSSDTTVATISGNTVTIVGEGITIITASQAGDANYNAATSVTQEFTVNPTGKLAQTITFAPLTNKTVGDAAFNLTATAAPSGLAVTYASSNIAVATISGNTVTIVGEGITTITASQAGDASYNAATSVTQEFTVNPIGKLAQTISFAPLTNKTIGDATFNLTATAAPSGLAVTFASSNTAVATISGNTVTIVGEGTTMITASQDGNDTYYAAENVERNLKVNGTGGGDVWSKLMKGVNQDASIPGGANYEKVMHERGHMQTISEAGFESVRFFIAYASSDFTAHQQRIQDALDHNLAVIICMWGPSGWYSSSQAENQIATRWKAIATWVETTWPSEDEIVFELLNETGAIGFPQTAAGHIKSMKLYGAAATAVREVSATRPIMISPSGWQDADLMSYVTQQNLGYDFANDSNLGMSIHFYKPSSGAIGWFAMNEYPLIDQSSDVWRKQIRDEVEHVTTWRTQNNVTSMPIVVTEWGCWTFPEREARGDLALVVEYQANYFREHNIGSTWYTGIQNNQRAFGIFDSEIGWNNVVVKAITEQDAPSTWPATNQFIGTEFEDWGSKTWKKLNGGTHERVQFEEALSGTSSLKLTAPVTIYQRSFVGAVSSGLEVGENLETRLGKYLVHLIQGKTYKISFMAKAETANAQLKFRMKENKSSANGMTINNQTGVTYYESTSQTIGTTGQTYEFTYTHNGATAWDVWCEFEIVSGTVILDKLDLRHVVQGMAKSNATSKSGTRSKSDTTSIITNTVSQSEEEMEAITIYPNPFESTFKISGVEADDTVSVYNLLGTQVFEGVGVSELDLSNLSRGAYILKVRDQIRRIIKL